MHIFFGGCVLFVVLELFGRCIQSLLPLLLPMLPVCGMYNDQAGYDLQTDADPNKYQNDDGIRLLVAADATAAAAPDTAAADVARAAVVCAACVGVTLL